jgi:hypothetical protein
VREQQVVLQFARRTHGDLQESPKLAVTFSAASLGDVRTDRCRRPPHLTRQPVFFLGRKRGTRPVNIQRESVRSLPNVQIPEALHETIPAESR